MIVDSSALIAVLNNEPTRKTILRAMAYADCILLPSPAYVETCIVLQARFEPAILRDFAELMEASKIEIIPFSETAAYIAAEAFANYGKGQAHKAQLNFGDCMVYAVAKAEHQPLLFVGQDFAQTDVHCVL